MKKTIIMIVIILASFLAGFIGAKMDGLPESAVQEEVEDVDIVLDEKDNQAYGQKQRLREIFPGVLSY